MPEKKKEMEKLAKMLLEKYGAKVLDLAELEEVSGGGMSSDTEDFCSNWFWAWLVSADPSLGKWSIDEQWRSLGMKHEVKNDKCVYTDLLTGKEVDFYGAWALVLKRIDKKIGGVSSEKIDKAFNLIYRKLSELMSKGY